MTDLSLSRSQMLLLSGSGNRALAEEVAAHLGQPLCQVTLRRFADGELFVKIDENVRGRDVYIIQPTNPPAENMMELLLLMDAARRASAARVTRGHSLLRVCPAGPEGPAAGGHQRQAHGQHGVDGGRRPGAGDGLPPAPAAGVLRSAGRPPVRGAGVREPLPAEVSCTTWSWWRPTSGSAKMARGLRQAAQRVARHHRQAAAVGQRRRGAERRRRGAATGTASSPTT